MVNLILFCVRDNKTGVFEAPYFHKHSAIALRSWEQGVNMQDSIYGKYPDDYTLYEMGTLNTDTGELVSHEEPRLFSNARDVYRSLKTAV